NNAVEDGKRRVEPADLRVRQREFLADRLNHRSRYLTVVKIQDVDGHQHGQGPPCHSFGGRGERLGWLWLFHDHGRQWYQMCSVLRAPGTLLLLLQLLPRGYRGLKARIETAGFLHELQRLRLAAESLRAQSQVVAGGRRRPEDLLRRPEHLRGVVE